MEQQDEPTHFICLSDHPQFLQLPKGNGGVPLGLAASDYIWEINNLKVAFLDVGGQYDALKAKVRQAANRWTEVANINFNYVQDPADSDIRISFTYKLGISRSYVGIAARTIVNLQEPTMNLGTLNDNSTQEEINGVVRHEFGHALGLLHEHQHPDVAFHWNIPQIMQDMTKHGWTAEVVQTNIIAKYDPNAPNINVVPYDPLSIMHYPFPPTWTLEGISMPINTDLSEGDIKIVQKEYGKRQ